MRPIRFGPGVAGGDRITIRQLLSHTAGLQDYWPQDYSFAAMEKPVAPQGILARWAVEIVELMTRCVLL